jgi:glycerophosphoryl diester phosphodiesterase
MTQPSRDETKSRLTVCAHRHGNDLTMLSAAESVGVDLVEVDIHLYRNELDARHEKTIGPVPLVWDRRRRPSWNPPRQRLDEVLASAQPETTFYVDLKGWNRRLSRRVIAALDGRAGYVVSARAWWLLAPFRSQQDVHVLRSIGAPWQLWWFRVWHGRTLSDGVSIRSDLLTAPVVADLKTRAQLVFAWGVSSHAHARELEQWGVDGVIVDSLDLARELLDRQR